MTVGESPVRWWCFEDGVSARTLSDIPPAESPIWEAHYSSDVEFGKRTTRKLWGSPFAPAFADLRKSAAEWSERLGYSLYDDAWSHGGGLHVTSPGGWLNCHLDYDRHPLMPTRRRALNIIAFVHPEWRQEWGGELYLADATGQPVQVFEPRPGRVVAFEVSDLSYHGVRQTSPNARERVSLAVYFLCEADLVRPCDVRFTRQKALFIPTRN